MTDYAHVSVDARVAFPELALRHGRKPTLWLPFFPTFAPHVLVRIALSGRDEDRRVLRDENLTHFFPVDGSNRLRQWHNDVGAGPVRMSMWE